jgi:hypothetical protein
MPARAEYWISFFIEPYQREGESPPLRKLIKIFMDYG